MMNLKRLKQAFVGLALLLSYNLVTAQDCDPQTWDVEDEEKVVKCAQALSVFHSDVTQKNFEGAYKHWRYYYCNCPKDDGTQKWVYIDGAKILVDFIKKNKKDKPVMEAYYDTLMNVYDNWVINYGDEGTVVGYKGLYTYAYQNYSLDRLEESKAYFEKSIDLLQNETSYLTINYYMTVLQKLSKYKKIDTAYWVEKYFVTSDIIDANLGDSGRYLDKWTKTREDIDNMMAPVLTCVQLLPMYEKKLTENPTVAELSKMIKYMEFKGCAESKTYEKAATALCNTEPSATCKAALAKIKYGQGQYGLAVTLFKEAIELEPDVKEDAKYYLGIADCNIKMGNTDAALSATNSAISLDPSFGRAYLLRGGVYATKAKNCKDFEAKAAYWVVVDQFIKAKSIDPSLSEICNSRIETYSKYFPTSGEIFFQTDINGQTLKVGDPYSVKCLGVTTTIRAKVGD